jgi:hypothetical protein
LLIALLMSWENLRAEILNRYEHARVHDHEVRLVLGLGHERVPMVVRGRGDLGIVVAPIARGSTSQLVTMVRAATMLGAPVVLLGATMCIRAVVAPDDVERVLQEVARSVLRIRRATTPRSTDVNAFAFAL